MKKKKLNNEVDGLIEFLFKLKINSKTKDEANSLVKAILCVKYTFQEEPYFSFSDYDEWFINMESKTELNNPKIINKFKYEY